MVDRNIGWLAEKIECTAIALGRLDATLILAPRSLQLAARVRHTCALAGGGEANAADVYASRGKSPAASAFHAALTSLTKLLPTERVAADVGRGSHIARTLRTAGLDKYIELSVSALEALRATHTDVPAIGAAAVVAGAIIAPAATSARAHAAADIAASAVLTGQAALSGPWMQVARLGAAGRAAAVQLDRSGQWEGWVHTYCATLQADANATCEMVAEVLPRCAAERARVRMTPRIGATDADVLGYLQDLPSLRIAEASQGLGITPPTVGTAIERLEAAGLAVEVTGLKRDRQWVWASAFEIAASP